MTARAVALACMALALGALAFRFLVLPRLDVEERGNLPFLESTAAKLGGTAALMLAVVALPRLFLQASTLVQPPDPVWPMAVNVLGTTWGLAMIVQVLAALAALAGFALARRRRATGWRIALIALIAIAFSAACMGHPMASARTAWASVPIDALHVLGVGAWVGTLAVLARLSFSGDLRSEGGGTIAALITAFHRVALSSAAIVIATGTLSVLLRVDRLRHLLTSPYGTIFFVKLAAVLVVMCLGAWNSRTAARRAQHGAMRSVRISLATEALFALVTIVATSVLVATDPPGEM